MARPTKFDDVVGTYPPGHPRAGQNVTVVDRVVDMLTAGNYFETACQAAGIAKQTGYDWLKVGAQAHTLVADGTLVSDLTDKQRSAMRFSDAVTAAMAEAEARDVATLDQLAGGGRTIITKMVKTDADGKTTETTERTEVTEPNPQVLQWRLERRFPDRWGRRRLEISGPDGEAIPIEARAKSLADALREYQGSGSEPLPGADEAADDRADDDGGSDESGV